LLHFDRSGSSLEELKRLPRHWSRYAHVCDAPGERPGTTEGLVHTARAERLLPGDGGIDVRGILSCLPCYIPYALEIPGDALAGQIGLEEYACRVLRASRDYLDLSRETCMAGATGPTSQARG
jgi:sugar phosphate isomerase/epimerase